MKFHAVSCALLFCVLLFFGCANIAGTAGGGGGSEVEIAGMLYGPDGMPAAQAVVTILPANFDPLLQGSPAANMTDTTSANGTYRFKGIDTGSYTISALNAEAGLAALIQGIHAKDSFIIIAADTLQKTGAIRAAVPDSLAVSSGYLYIPGTLISASMTNANGSVVLGQVPAGTNPAVIYTVPSFSAGRVLRYNIPVAPGDTTLIAKLDWKYCRVVFLNTTGNGAGVFSDVANFPVLVRLNSGNFNFSQAKAGGADLRFAKADTTPLPFEIERWDSAAGYAEIWVKLDTVKGNSGNQSFVMYWGASTSPATVSLSNGATVFDTTAGFQGVWHMAQTGNTTAKDATANHFDGTPHGMSAASSVSGAVGIAQTFNGSSSYIDIANSASGKLNFQENGVYSLSAWVYTEAVTDSFHLIVGKSHDQYSLKLTKTILGVGEKWEFNEYHGLTGWQISEDTPVVAKTWKYVTGVRNGTAQCLYVDGVIADSSFWLQPGTNARNTSEDVTIGRYLHAITYLADEGNGAFSGIIDEVRISSVACSADWIRLCYMNQKETDALVVFK
jgi:hypothetical protein